MLAGLKKCRPITSDGRLVARAISSRSSRDVFDARIAPGLQTASSLPNTCFFTAMSSKTASTTRSDLGGGVEIEVRFDQRDAVSCLRLGEFALGGG